MSVIVELIEKVFRSAEDAYRFIREDEVLSMFFEGVSNAAQTFVQKYPEVLWPTVPLFLTLLVIWWLIRTRPSTLSIVIGIAKFLGGIILWVSIFSMVFMLLRWPIYGAFLIVIAAAILAYLKAADPLNMLLLPKMTYEPPQPHRHIPDAVEDPGHGQ